MTDDWIKIMDTTELLEINVASAKLNEAGIENVVLNKKDSSYLVIGRAELYVLKSEAEKAMKVLEEAPSS